MVSGRVAPKPSKRTGNDLRIEGEMPINLTPGKTAGQTAVSDDRGVIAAVAMDQRDY